MKVRLLDLRPTQFSLGLHEVEDKISKMEEMHHTALKKYLAEHVVPVVLGPGGNIYLIDHHHLTRALWELGETEVEVDIKADFSKLSKKKFWAMMKKLKWIFLYDQFGGGPHTPQELPMSIRGLADNPYRSLAWLVRMRGGFNKASIPFAELYWAQYFRKHMRGFDPLSKKAIAKGLALCKLKGAKRLPGFK